MMIYNNYNVVQNIYERFAAGKRVARSCVFCDNEEKRIVHAFVDKRI